MGDLVWGDMLIALRKNQLQQLQLFRNQAIERRLNLVWQHRKERISCSDSLELTKLVYRQAQELVELQRQKQHNYETLRNQHASDVHDLLLSKMHHS